MKRVSIKDLKAGLSSAVADAEAGQTIMVTRHNKPVAQLGPAQVGVVRRGGRVGQGRIEPAIQQGTGGRYLSALQADRAGR